MSETRTTYDPKPLTPFRETKIVGSFEIYPMRVEDPERGDYYQYRAVILFNGQSVIVGDDAMLPGTSLVNVATRLDAELLARAVDLDLDGIVVVEGG